MFNFLRKVFSKNKEKGERNMADEKEVKKEVETEKVETKEPEKAEPAKEEKVEEKAEKVEEKKEEKPESKEEPKKEDAGEEPTEPQVQETEPEGNGIRIEDLVTKEMLAERLQAFEAKFDAVVKENEDLKNKLSAMADKYEEHDFGGLQKQGMMEKDRYAEASFDEYSKKFM
jgi:hypothetical protein